MVPMHPRIYCKIWSTADPCSPPPTLMPHRPQRDTGIPAVLPWIATTARVVCSPSHQAGIASSSLPLRSIDWSNCIRNLTAPACKLVGCLKISLDPGRGARLHHSAHLRFDNCFYTAVGSERCSLGVKFLCFLDEV